jgi:hypothetical protein
MKSIFMGWLITIPFKITSLLFYIEVYAEIKAKQFLFHRNQHKLYFHWQLNATDQLKLLKFIRGHTPKIEILQK